MIPTSGERHPGRVSRPGDTIGAQVGVVVVLGVGLVAVICWAGAQLGAVVSGHRWVPVGVTDGAVALVRLPHTLSNPASAWPVRVRSSLPGPVLYWTCTAVMASALASGAGWIAWWWSRRSRTRGSALGVVSHAGFAGPADLRHLTVAEPEAGRLTLGYSGRHLIAAEPRVSLAVIGPTGCGKTAGFAIPALLEWNGPIIATSVKADLIEASIDHRLQRGKVWIYDPTGSTGRRSASWSPLDECRTWAGAMRIASWLCEAAQTRIDSVNDGDFWYTQARRALAPYLYAAALSDRTMRDVVRWIDSQERAQIERVLTDDRIIEAAHARTQQQQRDHRDRIATNEMRMRERLTTTGNADDDWRSPDRDTWSAIDGDRHDVGVEHHRDDPIGDQVNPRGSTGGESGEIDALTVAKSLWAKEERLRGAVFATTENLVAAFADPGVGRPAAFGIDFDDWLRGDNTIYVVAASHEQARLRPVLTVLVQQALRRAYDLANNQHGTLDRPCLALLDEAGNIAPLRDLPAYASTARSHGITLVSVWQDIAQLRTLYGHRAATVLNNHGAKLFGTGIADDGTLEYVSRLIGDERRTELNVSADTRGGRRTVSEHVNYRRTAPADMLRRIRRNEAVLLYGSELPVRVRLRPWYAR
jgi:type IV secretion system protein VirD4